MVVINVEFSSFINFIHLQKNMVVINVEFRFVIILIHLQKNTADASNFDEDFTNEKPALTPIQDKKLLESIDPEAFLNFSYINPAYQT